MELHHRSTPVEFTFEEWLMLEDRELFMEWMDSEEIGEYVVKLMFYSEGPDIGIEYWDEEAEEYRQRQHTWRNPPPLKFKEGMRAATRQPLPSRVGRL
jgi:hypothetical protein